MRHYEIVLMIHPDQSDQVSNMLDKYKSIITNEKGKLHRLEDWGRRQLAYPIQKLHKAHYLLMNIECVQSTIAELRNLFRFNDAIIRHLVIRRDDAITKPSPMMKAKDDKAYSPTRGRPASDKYSSKDNDTDRADHSESSAATASSTEQN